MKYLEFDKDRKFDLVLIGRVAVDFNPAPSEKFGQLKNVSMFTKYVGGSPANIAIGTSRNGLKVGFIGKVSNDQLGDFVTETFNNEGIDTSHIVKAKNGEKIGLTFTEMISENESSILMYRNMAADLALDVTNVDEEYIKSSKAILISGTSLAESPSREAALKAMILAKKNNTRIIFDIDYRSYNWKNKDEISIYYSILAKNSDIIMGSREEFDLTESMIMDSSNDKKSFDLRKTYGVKILVIKHGMKGSTAYANGESYIVKPFPIKARKGFGGGDGYASAFIYGIFKGLSLSRCLELASAEASLMVKNNSSSDLPNIDIVNSFMTDTEKKYGKMISDNMF